MSGKGLFFRFIYLFSGPEIGQDFFEAFVNLNSKWEARSKDDPNADKDHWYEYKSQTQSQQEGSALWLLDELPPCSSGGR